MQVIWIRGNTKVHVLTRIASYIAHYDNIWASVIECNPDLTTCAVYSYLAYLEY